MLGPGIRNLALGELGQRDVQSMIREGETLFVEFKSDIAKGSGFQIAKAAASFANTLGGWILVGVRDGRPCDGWEPPAGDFIDVIRQRLEGHVDPLPSFSAAVVQLETDRIGVVRVYESTDTPHILSDGSVVVREPAQDSKLRKRGVYEPTPVRSHYELLQLATRGRAARESAEGRFEPGVLPLIEGALRLGWVRGMESHHVSFKSPAVVVRIAPLTITRRWIQWAVSESAVGQLRECVACLIGVDVDDTEVQPFARGVAVATKSSSPQPWTPGASKWVSRSATAAADAGGVFGIRLDFELHQNSGYTNYHREMTAEAICELVSEVYGQAAKTLADAEHLGRAAVHGYLLQLSGLYAVDPQRPGIEPQHPSAIPLGGDVTVGGGDDATHSALAEAWAVEVLRSCGLPAWGTRL